MLLTHHVTAQHGFIIKPPTRTLDIPFEFKNNFIILTILLNDVLPLRFILDTGAEHTILCKKEISDYLKINYERTFRIKGSDLNTELTAYLARNVKLVIQQKAIAVNQDILVLEEDYFRFEEYAGIQIHGIMSANIFSQYVIKIDYRKKIITLFDRESSSPNLNGFQEFPIEVFRNKIYLNTLLSIRNESSTQVKLLVDTGAGLPLLLFANSNPLLLAPENAIPSNIGMGLGGHLAGYTGRVHKLQLDTLTLYNILSYFQEIDTTQSGLSILNGRNGLIGNMILSRFQIVVDFRQSKIWLKPIRNNFSKPFEYDKSGINLIATGFNLDNYTVQAVVPFSPAWNADIRKGDIVKWIGGLPASLLSLEEIIKKLRKAEGKKIKLTLIRGKKRLLKTIILKNLI